MTVHARLRGKYHDLTPLLPMKDCFLTSNGYRRRQYGHASWRTSKEPMTRKSGSRSKLGQGLNLSGPPASHSSGLLRVRYTTFHSDNPIRFFVLGSSWLLFGRQRRGISIKAENVSMLQLRHNLGNLRLVPVLSQNWFKIVITVMYINAHRKALLKFNNSA
jgi:hypothetical protein